MLKNTLKVFIKFYIFSLKLTTSIFIIEYFFVKYKALLYFSFLFFCSCSFFTTSEKSQEIEDITSFIDFTKVDVSPSFVACNDLIDEEKTACFRREIHQKLTENLSKHTIRVSKTMDATINLDLLIDKQGKVTLQKVYSPKIIEEEIPKLDSLLQVSVNELPVLNPAIKRGIPVATQYRLPIRVLLNE